MPSPNGRCPLREADWLPLESYKAALRDEQEARGWDAPRVEKIVDDGLSSWIELAEMFDARVEFRVGETIFLDHRCRYELFDGTVVQLDGYAELGEWLRRDKLPLVAHFHRAQLRKETEGCLRSSIDFGRVGALRL